MYKNISTILTLLTATCIILKIFSGFSLIGMWTEVICLTLLVYCAFKTRHRIKKPIIKGIIYFVNSLSAIIIVLAFLGTLMSTMYRNESFYFIEVENRLFNAYVYRPFALPPSSDKLIISETSLFYPFLEKPKWYEGKFIDFEIIETDGTGTKKEKLNDLKRYIQYRIKNENED